MSVWEAGPLRGVQNLWCHVPLKPVVQCILLNISVICAAGGVCAPMCPVAFRRCWLRVTWSTHIHLKDRFTSRAEGRTDTTSPRPALLLRCCGGGTGSPGEELQARLNQGKWHGVGSGVGAGCACRSGGSQGDSDGCECPPRE